MTVIPAAVPRFLSIEFHTRFFPAVLGRRIRHRRATSGSPFANHISIEYPIMLMLCFVLAALGLPSALTKGSIVGGIVGGVGSVGAITLIVQSVYAQLETRPTFAAFRVAAFAFCVMLGLTIGLVAGSGLHSRALEAGAAVAGLVCGYVVGIGAGLWAQYLGWIGMWVELAAGLAALGMLVGDIVYVAR
jgi:hypothetical protein